MAGLSNTVQGYTRVVNNKYEVKETHGSSINGITYIRLYQWIEDTNPNEFGPKLDNWK